MQANSLLGNARAIERILDNLLKFRRLAGQRKPLAYATAIRATLDDFVTLLAASTPAPNWQRGGANGDAALADVLQGLYDKETATIDVLAKQVDGGTDTITELTGSDRIEQVGNHLVVPLTGSHAGDNWRVLLDILVDVLDMIHQKARRVHRRVRADSGDINRGTFDRVIDRIRVLTETLKKISGYARFVGRASKHDTRLIRSFRRLLERYGYT